MRSAAKLIVSRGAGRDRRQTVSAKARRCWRRRCGRCGRPTTILAKARDERGPLDLDLPERKILLDGEGRVADVIVPERLTAHRLIEEFMIQANVAAAETLEEHRTRAASIACMSAPSKEKLTALRDFLATLDMKLPHAGDAEPEPLQRHSGASQGACRSPISSTRWCCARSRRPCTRLRTSATSVCICKRYAHFTSPIRRYADLLVHRALVRALKLGAGGFTDEEIGDLDRDSRRRSRQAERRAMAAERDTSIG